MSEHAMLYEQDFYAWTQEQAKLIREGTFAKLDIRHLIEEVEDMGKHEKRELSSRLEVLLLHLLKWHFQPNYENKNSWKYTIKEQRRKIRYHLEDNPSLKNKDQFQIVFDRAYEASIYDAIKETGLGEDVFPTTCKWEISEVLDEEFYPN